MYAATIHHPVFGALTSEESWALLKRNHVGRLCFMNGRTVDIEPIHYVLGNQQIIMRSAAAAKLGALAHNPYVAFEVDEIDGTFNWRSVVAHGTVYLTDRDGAPRQSIVYAVHVSSIAGRIAVPDPSATAW